MHGVCGHCKELKRVYVGGERSDLLDAIIHEYKYDSVRRWGAVLAELIDRAVGSLAGEIVIVPLPTIGRHVRERGFDHMELVARRWARMHDNYQICKVLQRNNNSVQVGAKKSDRLAQAKQAYRVNPRAKVRSGATYVLLDDVWTTGASMRAGIAELEKAGIKNTVVAILAVSRLN